MPKDLPGLYWDEERQRYFPISSRPTAPPPAPATISRTQATGSKKSAERSSTSRGTSRRWHPPLHSQSSLLSTGSHLGNSRASHDILSFHYAATSRLTRVKIPTIGNIQAFYSTQVNDQTWRFIGDDQGWLYSDKHGEQETRSGISYWSPNLNLQPSSPISSISVSGTRCVSTCLGPGRIAVQDLTTPERIFLLNINGTNDIRASDLNGKSLVLGASKKAIYIPDIDSSRSPQYLFTRSDVFSVVQDRSLVWTGARNGTVERFDTRMAKHNGQKLFDTRFHDVEAPRSSVVHIHLIHENEILLSHLNGDLLTYDARFPSSTPLTVFAGHVNRDIPNLGIAVDTDHDFIFAAGQDCRVRGWSLRTGRSLSPPAMDSFRAAGDHPLTLSSSLTTGNPFLTVFPSPVVALQVTQESGEAGRSLWAASSHDLYQFHLGQLMV